MATEVTRVFDLLPQQLEKFPQDDMLAMKEKGEWRKYSTRQVQEMANQISLGLLKMGVKKDDKIAIISANRPEWMFIDFGIQQLGAVSVPLYPTITEQDYRYILNDAEVKMIFLSDTTLLQRVKSATKDITTIQGIFTFDNIAGAQHWSEVAEQGKSQDIALLKPHKDAVQPDDLLTLIYTSGTTGNPKGVMLTHNNIVSNLRGTKPYVPVNHEHRALSFLPLSHILERMVTYLYINVGVSIYYAESLEKIGENLKEVKPHVFVTVPRLLEKVYDKIVAKGQELTGLKRALFFWALELGLKYDTQKDGGVWYNTQLKLANKLIFSKWREALGGNIIAVVSGGAALQPRLARVFWSAQIRVMEGYGLTETSPVIAVNRHSPDENVIGTVGPVIDNVELKLNPEDNEILTRGPGVMKGYFKRPDLTDEVIDKDGWFHTGDIGQMVDGKYLKIIDRKKEIFKTSGGKYVAPQPIENKFKESPLIDQIMVIGDGQKFAAALIVPSFQNLQDWCKLNQIPYTNDREIIVNPMVRDEYRRVVAEFNQHFAQYEQMKKFELMPELWTIETGELTPSMKVKRKFIVQKYQSVIDTIFA